MARLGVVFNMRNQYKDTHNTFILTPFHSFNSFNSRFISLPFTPLTPLTPKKNQWKINIKRPFPTSW